MMDRDISDDAAGSAVPVLREEDIPSLLSVKRSMNGRGLKRYCHKRFIGVYHVTREICSRVLTITLPSYEYRLG